MIVDTKIYKEVFGTRPIEKRRAYFMGADAIWVFDGPHVTKNLWGWHCDKCCESVYCSIGRIPSGDPCPNCTALRMEEFPLDRKEYKMYKLCQWFAYREVKCKGDGFCEPELLHDTPYNIWAEYIDEAKKQALTEASRKFPDVPAKELKVLVSPF